MIRVKRRSTGGAEINMAPLLDMVFILLIFFMVTTHFTRDTGLDIEKPTASTSRPVTRETILIGLNQKGDVSINGRVVARYSIEGQVRRLLAAVPDAPVMLVADRRTLTEDLIQVYDQCKLAGAESVAVGTRQN